MRPLVPLLALAAALLAVRPSAACGKPGEDPCPANQVAAESGTTTDTKAPKLGGLGGAIQTTAVGGNTGNAMGGVANRIAGGLQGDASSPNLGKKIKGQVVPVDTSGKGVIPKQNGEQTTPVPDLTVVGPPKPLPAYLLSFGISNIPPTLAEASSDPEFQAAVVNIAKDPQASTSYFRQRLARNPNDSAALTGLMLTQRAQGDTKVSLESARRLQALEPENELAKAAVKQLENQVRAAGTVDRFKKFSDGFKPEAPDAGDLQTAQKAMGSGSGGTARTPNALRVPDPTAGLTDGFVPAPRTAGAA